MRKPQAKQSTGEEAFIDKESWRKGKLEAGFGFGRLVDKHSTGTIITHFASAGEIYDYLTSSNAC